jgi:hypothetical protein
MDSYPLIYQLNVGPSNNVLNLNPVKGSLFLFGPGFRRDLLILIRCCWSIFWVQLVVWRGAVIFKWQQIRDASMYLLQYLEVWNIALNFISFYSLFLTSRGDKDFKRLGSLLPNCLRRTHSHNTIVNNFFSFKK